MYATRPLSLYHNFKGARSEKPPVAPYSGYLVVTDEESDSQDVACWGMFNKEKITKLPIPQDKVLKIVNVSDHEKAYTTKVWFIPVLDQPLSSNRYYVIKAAGKYKGLACTCSKENDIAGCCFSDAIIDVRPTSFDHRDIYQQFEIHHYYKDGFYAKPVAGDGFPPKFLRRKGWKIYTSNSLPLQEAKGLNSSLSTRLPDFKFPIYYKCSPPIILATWYCPFVFVKERNIMSRELAKSLVYEMTLQQWWEEIYSCHNESNNESNDEGDNVAFVSVNAEVGREKVLVYGNEGVVDEGQGFDDGFVWFKGPGLGLGSGLGLSVAIVEKIRWVEAKRDWDGGEERVVGVEEVKGEWKRFGCYVLVESFVLRRNDGVVLLSWKFRHTNKRKCKWE